MSLGACKERKYLARSKLQISCSRQASSTTAINHHDNQTGCNTARSVFMLIPVAYIANLFVGRRATSFPAKPWSRCLATAVDTIEASLENSLKETHSIESMLQGQSQFPVPRIRDSTHSTIDYAERAVRKTYHSIRRQRKHHLPLSTITSSL